MAINPERIYHAMHSIKKSRMLFARASELPPGEFFILDHVCHLEEAGCQEVFVSRLHNSERMTLSAVSQLVSALENKGLVERSMSKADRRKIVVSTTARGRELIMRARKKMDQDVGMLLKRFGEQNSEQLISLLEQLAAVTEQLRQEQPAQHEEGDSCFD